MNIEKQKSNILQAGLEEERISSPHALEIVAFWEDT
jgi:hypothetical protein